MDELPIVEGSKQALVEPTETVATVKALAWLGECTITSNASMRRTARTTPELLDELEKFYGREICKRTKPKCEKCPVSSPCAFFAGHRRGRSTSA